MALSVTGIIYHFQMSAVVVINGDNVEGTLSAYSHLSTVFVPVPGIYYVCSCLCITYADLCTIHMCLTPNQTDKHTCTWMASPSFQQTLTIISHVPCPLC